MAVIAIPSGLQVHTLSWGIQDYSLTFANQDSGAQQSRILGPARWTAVLTLNLSVGQNPMAIWKAMLAQLRGKTNQLAMYDVKNPAPAGTARNSGTLSAGIAVGDTSLPVTGFAAGATLLPGDWIGAGAGSTRQLFMVTAAITLNGAGAGSVTVEPPSRYVQSSGAAVTVDKPTCLMRRTDSTVSWQANAGAEGSVTLSLVESWE